MADTVINPALQQEQEAAAVLSESILPGMPAGTGAAKPTSPRRLEHGGMQQGPAQMHDSQGMNVGAVPPLPPAPMYTLPPLPVPHPGVADRGLSEMGNGSVPDGGAAAGGGGGGSAAMLSHGSHDGESLHHDYIQQHIVAGHPTTSASSSNVAKPGLYPPPPVPYYQSQYYAAFQQPPHPHYPQQMHMGGESRILDYADVAPLSRVLKRPQPVKFASSSSSNGNDDYVDNIPVMLGKHPREDDEDDLDTPDEVYQMDGPMGGHDSMMQDDSYEPMDENSGRDSPAVASTSKGKGAKGKSAKEKKGVQRPKLKGTACTACRKSKLKCDEGQPCAPCSRRRVDCVRDPGLRLQAWYGELQAAGQAGKFIDGIYAGHFGPSSALHSLGLFAAQQHREQQQQQAAQQAGQDGHAHSPVYLHQQNQSSDLPQQHQHQMSSSRTEGVGEPSNYSNDSSKPALQANHPSEAVQESRAQARAAFQQKVAERASRNGTTSTSTPTHGRNTRASAVKAEGENDGASGLPADADDSASVRPSPHRSTSDSLSGILNERNEDGVSFPSYLEPYRDILLEAGIDSLETLRADLQLEMLKDYVVFLFETYPEKLYNQTQKFKLQYALQKALS